MLFVMDSFSKSRWISKNIAGINRYIGHSGETYLYAINIIKYSGFNHLNWQSI